MRAVSSIVRGQSVWLLQAEREIVWEGYSPKVKISTLALDERAPHGFVGYAAYGYTDAVSSVMCRVRPTHSCTLAPYGAVFVTDRL